MGKLFKVILLIPVLFLVTYIFAFFIFGFNPLQINPMSYSSPGYSSSIEESKKRDIFVDEYFLHFDGLYPIKFDTINTIFLEQDWTESFFKSRTNKIEGINNRHLIISFLKYKNGFEKRWSLSHESNSFYSIIMNHHYLCISRINFKDTIPLIYTDLETKESQKAWLIKKE